MQTYSVTQQPSKALRVCLWIVQALLAAMFGMAGSMKLTQPIAQLATSLPWAGQVPEALVRFIGFSEVLIGVGLLLPSLLRLKPGLTVWAAVGLVAVMLLAAIFHVSRGEYSVIPVNLVLAALALFVAWGRARKAPILPKA